MPRPSPPSIAASARPALDALLGELASLPVGDERDGAGEDTRDLLRRAIVGILSELDPADPAARAYRRRLAAALG